MNAPVGADFVRCGESGGSLRVALVTETFPPEIYGVAMTVGLLVDGLLERGHTLQLIRPRQPLDPRCALPAKYEEVLTTGIPIPMYSGLRFGPPSTHRLLELWQQRRPDLVHVVTEGPLGWSAIRAARRLGIPLSSGFHTNFHAYCDHYRLGLLRRLVGAYLRWLHNRTQLTLVPTSAMARQLASDGYHGLAVVSRGVDLQRFAATRRSPELRARWGASGNEPVVLYVGRLAEEKNVRLVTRCFAAIRRVRPDARLVLVGDGPLRETLHNDCPAALLTGTRSGIDLAAHYASADLFLFPSLTETYGNVVAEALASGLAVVAYAQAAAAELIVDGEQGRVLTPHDESGFIAAAVELAQHDDERNRLANAAPLGVANLHWARVHDAFTRALTELVARQAPTGRGRGFEEVPGPHARAGLPEDPAPVRTPLEQTG